MSNLISIIIPVYNVEKYLSKCVESVLKQTYRNLEIILVDDGSPDKCGEICDLYAKKDQRVKVIHKKNGGISDARNYGMKIATGDYLSFIDSDDWVDEHYIEELYHLLLDEDADLSAMSLCNVNEEDIEIGRAHTGEKKIFDDCGAIESMFYQNGLPWSGAVKLYKRSLFHGIEFPVGVVMEDKATIYKVFAKCKKIVFIDLPYYKYLIRQGSTMRSNFSEKRLRSFDIQEELNLFIEKNYPQFSYLAHAYTIKVAISMLCMMSAAKYVDRKMSEKFFDYLFMYKKEFFSAKCIDKRFKAVGLFLIILRKILKGKIYSNFIYEMACTKVASVITTK